MSPRLLAQLYLESVHPRGVAAKIESDHLRQVLYELAMFVDVCQRVVGDYERRNGSVDTATILKVREALVKARNP